MHQNIDEVLYNEIYLVYSVSNFIHWIDEDVRRISTSGIFRRVRQEFEKKIHDENYEMKYFGMSGHDSNISPILMSLGMASVDCLMEELKNGPTPGKVCEKNPGYASNLIWELSKQEEQYLVRVLYNGKAIFDCSSEISDSEYFGYCTIEQYIKISQDKFEFTDEQLKEVC